MLKLSRSVVPICLAWALISSALPLRAYGTAGWLTTVYAGSTATLPSRATTKPIPTYSLSYPPGWTVQHWPDTLATYGQVSLWSPSGGILDLVIVPLHAGGPTLGDLIDHDQSSLDGSARTTVRLPIGRATRLVGWFGCSIN